MASAWRPVNGSHAAPTSSSAELLEERERLRREKEQLTAEVRVLELKVQKLQRMLWDRKSERLPRDDGQGVLFNEPAGARPEAAGTAAATPATKVPGAPRAPSSISRATPTARRKSASPAFSPVPSLSPTPRREVCAPRPNNPRFARAGVGHFYTGEGGSNPRGR